MLKGIRQGGYKKYLSRIVDRLLWRKTTFMAGVAGRKILGSGDPGAAVARDEIWSIQKTEGSTA